MEMKTVGELVAEWEIETFGAVSDETFERRLLRWLNVHLEGGEIATIET